MINWKNIYNELIEKGKSQIVEGYSEKHHILPKHLGGNNSKVNLVKLTHRQHILAHYILWKCYQNVNDKIAYKMMGGQIEEGKSLKGQQGAKNGLKLRMSRLKECFQDKEWCVNKIKKTRETNYKNNKGNWFSKESIELMRSNALGKNLSIEARKQISKSRLESNGKLNKEEFRQMYIEPKLGANHPMYGKKRPGELASNFGKSKGSYELITPENQNLEFHSLKELMKFGISEKLVRSWVNKGKIYPLIKEVKRNGKTYSMKCRKFKWDGYEIKFNINSDYGLINKKFKEKRELNSQRL